MSRATGILLPLLCLLCLLSTASPAMASEAITEGPDGIFGEYRSRAVAWWSEFNRFRNEQGLPSLVWSEKMYIVLVEYAKEIAKYNPDADGLPSPAERPTRKARRVHKWNISFMDNPSLSTKSIYSARESIERFGGVKLIRSIRDANQNAGAVAVVNRKNNTDVYVVEAVSRLNVGDILRVQQSIDISKAILGMSDQAERLKATKELVVLNHIDTIFVLFPLLRDQNHDVAKEAMRGLTQLNDPCLVEPLISYMYVVDDEMKKRIATHLAKLTGRRDMGTDHVKWRRWFESSSGAIVKKDTPTPTKTALTDKEIGELVAAFDKEYKGADAMGKVDALKSIAAVRHKKVAKALCKGLGHKDPMVRKAAAEALKSQGDKTATAALLKAFFANKAFTGVQVAIIEALGATGDPRAVVVLGEDLRPNYPELTKAKLEALGLVRDKRSIQALVDFMWRWGRGGRQFRQPLHKSLTTLTGKDYGNDRNAWKEWWDRTKKWFRFPKKKK